MDQEISAAFDAVAEAYDDNREHAQIAEFDRSIAVNARADGSRFVTGVSLPRWA